MVRVLSYQRLNRAQVKSAVQIVLVDGAVKAQELKKQKEIEERFGEFKETYFWDPVKFVLECIQWKPGKSPTKYQIEIIENIITNIRTSVRGPHGLGKTALVSWLIHWFALTRDGLDWKIPTTASSWPQLSKFLWPEVHKWSRMLDWEKIGRPPYDERRELLMLKLRLETGEAFAIASDNSALIEGAHADRLFYIYDESKSIKDETFDASEGALVGAGSDDESLEAFALSVSTPGEPVGRFYDIQSHKPGYEDWKTRAVKDYEVVEAGRVTKGWQDARKNQWGEDSAIFQNRVLGEFASSEADTVISMAWVERAVAKWYETDWDDPELEFHSVGVDVARYGQDKTVLALRFGDHIKELREYARQDTMQTAGRVKGILDKYNKKASKSVIDVIGMGAGVVDRLREQGYEKTIAFHSSEKTEKKDKSGELGFRNLRSAAWWNLRELLQDDLIAIPDNDLLMGDLVTPKWKVTSNGKIQVEGKEDIRKRLSRSTDYADAVIYVMWPGMPKGTWSNLADLVDDDLSGEQFPWSY